MECAVRQERGGTGVVMATWLLITKPRSMKDLRQVIRFVQMKGKKK